MYPTRAHRDGGRRRRTALALAAALAGAQVACLPIPVPQTTTVFPDTAVAVADPWGNAVPGARVTLKRYVVGPPPHNQTHTATGSTSASGVARFAYVEQVETTMPLMMHGVLFYGWELCAEATGVGAAMADYDRAGNQSQHLVVHMTLDPAVSGCAWTSEPPLTPQP